MELRVDLNKEIHDQIKERVDEGAFNSKAEYIRHLIREDKKRGEK